MDFSIIEGLTDEELNELYDDNVVNTTDRMYIVACGCKADWSSKGYVHFGGHLWGHIIGIVIKIILIAVIVPYIYLM